MNIYHKLFPSKFIIISMLQRGLNLDDIFQLSDNFWCTFWKRKSKKKCKTTLSYWFCIYTMSSTIIFCQFLIILKYKWGFLKKRNLLMRVSCALHVKRTLHLKTHFLCLLSNFEDFYVQKHQSISSPHPRLSELKFLWFCTLFFGDPLQSSWDNNYKHLYNKSWHHVTYFK